MHTSETEYPLLGILDLFLNHRSQWFAVNLSHDQVFPKIQSILHDLNHLKETTSRVLRNYYLFENFSSPRERCTRDILFQIIFTRFLVVIINISERISMKRKTNYVLT